MNETTLSHVKTRKDQAERLLARLTLALLTMMLVTVAATAFYPWNPITKLQITVMGQPVAGDVLVVRVDYCKVRPWVPSDMEWSLMNDVSVAIPTVTFALPVGCQVIQVLLPLPKHIAPGEYRLQESLVYQPWPWTTYTYIVRSEPFLLRAAQ